MNKHIRKALIVGAGIGGLTSAVALRRAGVEVDVVEDKVGRTVYHVGIIIQANAVWALESLGLADETIRAAAVLKRLRLFDGVSGHLLHDLPPMQIPVKAYLPDLGITRPALHDVLQAAAERAGASIRFGLTYNSIAQSDAGVEVRFTDGSQGRYDLVIGSDGAYSSMRRLLWEDRYTNRYTGQSTWRYNLPRLPGLETADLYENVAGQRAGLIPLNDTQMYVLLVSHEPGNPRQAPERLAELLRDRLAPYRGPIAKVRDAITDASQVVYARRFERCKRIWSASVQIGEWERRPTPDADPAALTARMQREVFFKPI